MVREAEKKRETLTIEMAINYFIMPWLGGMGVKFHTNYLS